ncbi:LLM class flavin-dependent oxidoreductase [Metabacillus sp. GX 13764]|uniref:LLM class flavin-dependent oxidoreductase n=1 Tax=Metabacillus kandeliae TaxID=2900151 RepID=UPI001E4ED30D|nr:LLM class flavin-dependent oxidoreductase [Metabacillus kandeliae]MCD7033592.1 LLM class flavin-dependent oxidoreductase [Metabacillus kandeliae]
MKLGILDQAPVLEKSSPAEALRASIELAAEGDKAGFTRYWIAEHHSFQNLSCPAPEVLLGLIGEKTKHIRIGSGAVLLPHYSPFKVAETFNMLSVLFPDRIDLGIGRAPGGSAEASIALSGNFLQKVKEMPDKYKELLHFLKSDFPEESLYAKISASPLPQKPPVPWVLGTSSKSAILAAETGTSYAFGHFMSDKDGPEIVQSYKKQFVSNGFQPEPEVIAAVSAVCAETEEKAVSLAEAALYRQIKQDQKETSLSSSEKDMLHLSKAKMAIGTPDQVLQKLENIQKQYEADEIMVVTHTPDYESRTASYRLLGKYNAG